MVLNMFSLPSHLSNDAISPPPHPSRTARPTLSYPQPPLVPCASVGHRCLEDHPIGGEAPGVAELLADAAGVLPGRLGEGGAARADHGGAEQVVEVRWRWR